jgi:hypothetical protein
VEIPKKNGLDIKKKKKKEIILWKKRPKEWKRCLSTRRASPGQGNFLKDRFFENNTRNLIIINTTIRSMYGPKRGECHSGNVVR